MHLALVLPLTAFVANAHANQVVDNLVENVLKNSFLTNEDIDMFTRQKLCQEILNEHNNLARAEDHADRVSPARRLSAIRSLSSACGPVTSQPRNNIHAGAPSFLPSISSLLPASPRSKTIQHAFNFLAPVPAIAADVKKADTHVTDNGGLLSANTRNTLKSDLTELESRTGFDLDVQTVKKLESDDAQAYAEKVFAKKKPGAAGDKAGLLVIVERNGEGALVGGDAFMDAVGDELSLSIISDTIPLLAADAKFNEATLTSVKRVSAKLKGEPVPDGPKREAAKETRTYKTKAEVDKSRNVTTTAVAILLFISFVVPMLQYFGYVNKD